MAQPAKIEFHSSLIFIDSIQYVIPKIAALQHISTKLNFPSWLTGLLSGPCSLFFARCTNLDMYSIHARLEAKSFYTIHTYIHFALQLNCCAGLRLKTKTDINRCLNVIQYIKLTKKRAPTKDPDSKIHLYRPGLHIKFRGSISEHETKNTSWHWNLCISIFYGFHSRKLLWNDLNPKSLDWRSADLPRFLECKSLGLKFRIRKKLQIKA